MKTIFLNDICLKQVFKALLLLNATLDTTNTPIYRKHLPEIVNRAYVNLA